MKRIVVGIDDSPAAAAAAHWAAHVAADIDAELVAVHAFDMPYSEITPDDLHRLIDDRRKLVDGEWTALARKAGASVRTIVEQGDPGTVVLEVAEAEDADLVVVGRHGHAGEPGILHIGSLAEHCAHHSPIPLAVIPSDAVIPASRFVVGADGTPASLDVVTWAAQLASPARTSVLGVVVAGHSADKQQLDDLAAGWEAPLAAVGITEGVVIRNDDSVVDGLANGAEALGGDVLVVGMHKAGKFTGLRAGGTAIKALHHTALPIVLVPPTQH